MWSGPVSIRSGPDNNLFKILMSVGGHGTIYQIYYGTILLRNDI